MLSRRKPMVVSKAPTIESINPGSEGRYRSRTGHGNRTKCAWPSSAPGMPSQDFQLTSIKQRAKLVANLRRIIAARADEIAASHLRRSGQAPAGGLFFGAGRPPRYLQLACHEWRKITRRPFSCPEQPAFGQQTEPCHLRTPGRNRHHRPPGITPSASP